MHVLPACLLSFAPSLSAVGDPPPFGPELFEAPVRLVEPYVSVCDLDGDGAEELLVSGHAGLLVLAEPDVDGGVAYATQGVPTHVRHASAADLDGDGLQEVVVAGEHLLVFPNGGGFERLGAAWIAGRGAHDFAAAGDVDGDGDLDLIAGAGGALRTYANEGAGVFRLLGEVHDPLPRPELTLGDWNGDGVADVARHVGAVLRIRLGDGRGGWSAPDDLEVGSFDELLDAGDVDGDGDLDLLVPSSAAQGGPRLLLCAGDGSFLEGPALEGLFAGAVLVGVGLVDVDGDGLAELLVANTTGCHRIDDPLGTPSVERWPIAGVRAWRALRTPSQARPDVLGLVEVGEPTAFHDSWGLALYDARSTGDARWFLDALPPQEQAADAHLVADLDGDGHLDRLSTQGFAGRFRVRLGTSAGWTGPEYGLGFGGSIFVAADTDGDGDLDLLCRNYIGLGVELRLHHNDGLGRFDPGVVFDPGVSPYSTFGVLGDLDGNGLDDLGASYGSELTILLTQGDDRFTFGGMLEGFGLPDTIADLDGDGALDFVVSGLWQDRIAYGDGLGGIRHVLSAPIVAGLPTRVLAAGDVDLDGRPELLTRTLGPGGHLLGLHSSRDGVHWDEPLVFRARAQVNGARIVDADGDGLPDLMLRRSGPRTRILRQERSGVFRPWSNAAWFLWPELVHDVDGDGLPELIGADGILTRGAARPTSLPEAERR